MTVTVKFAKTPEQYHNAIDVALAEQPESIPLYDKQFTYRHVIDGVQYFVSYTIRNNAVVRVVRGRNDR